MGKFTRRDFLTLGGGLAASMGLFPAAIRRALAVAPHRVTGTIEDVQHIVVLMQENRSFDHYFGTLRGVRGFADRFPIPVPASARLNGKTVWFQRSGSEGPEQRVVAPFHLDTRRAFATMRVEGTPHSLPDAQLAWNEGVISHWPTHKSDHAMGYYAQQDIPFQFALAEAFTLCDAYHCSMHAGTNPNRCFLWTGSNDPAGEGHGPVVDNRFDHLAHLPDGGYTWTTYCERLERAGVRWQVYQDMRDNFTDNPLAGFRAFRAAHRKEDGALSRLAERGLSTRDLDDLKRDVLAGELPQVSWIVATAEGSEHPGPSSPAQGADYTARVLDALTSDPDVWARTVLLVNFDENDGFFDHVPPPAAPSRVRAAGRYTLELAGASTVETRGEYHETAPAEGEDPGAPFEGRPYGPGPRVPMYVISPWSRGGWVVSEVFDHTSVIRFMERRFGVFEPNISPFRRAVCGDLTSAFDFTRSDDAAPLSTLPDTEAVARRARALTERTTPPIPSAPALPAQEYGVRRSRALPYELYVHADTYEGNITLSFLNGGSTAAVFHVYDRRHLERTPRRYVVGASRALVGSFETSADSGEYDLWVLGPNGFHRHFAGSTADSETGQPSHPEVRVSYERASGGLRVQLLNQSYTRWTCEMTAQAYGHAKWWYVAEPGARVERTWPLDASFHWYDFALRVHELPGFYRRFAGRVETGRHGFSDPAMGGPSHGDQQRL